MTNIFITQAPSDVIQPASWTDYNFKFRNDGVVLNGDYYETSKDIIIDINKVSGLDMAEFRTSERVREGDDGGFLDAEFENMRTIILEGALYAPQEHIERMLDLLKSNFAPSARSYPFYFSTPGGLTRIVFCKSLGVKYSWEQARRYGATTLQIQLKAEDPTIYGEPQSLSTTLAMSQTGLGFPVSFPVGFGGVSPGGTVSAVNAGNKATGAVITFTSHVRRPSVVHQQLNKVLTFDIELEGNDTLSVDLRNRSVTLNGQANRRGALVGGSRWFKLMPGTNNLKYLGSSDSSSQMTVSFMPAHR